MCLFKSNCSAQCAVRQPSKKVDAILEDAIINAILFRDRVIAKISVILLVPSGISRQ